MSEFIVHTIPGSPYGRAVLATLEEKGARYRISAVTPGTLRSPEHLARHPFGRVPVLEHAGFRLFETQAILRYLDRVLPEPRLTPPDVRQAAYMEQLMNVNDWYVFQGVASVIGFQRIVAPRLLGAHQVDEAAIAAAMPKAHRAIDALACELGSKPFFTGAQPSLADLLFAPQLDFLQQTPEWRTLTGEHANLPAWLTRMSARPSMARTTWERVTEMAAAA
jgi:glutathione S-transferase